MPSSPIPAYARVTSRSMDMLLRSKESANALAPASVLPLCRWFKCKQRRAGSEPGGRSDSNVAIVNVVDAFLVGPSTPSPSTSACPCRRKRVRGGSSVYQHSNPLCQS